MFNGDLQATPGECDAFKPHRPAQSILKKDGSPKRARKQLTHASTIVMPHDSSGATVELKKNLKNISGT